MNNPINVVHHGINVKGALHGVVRVVLYPPLCGYRAYGATEEGATSLP